MSTAVAVKWALIQRAQLVIREAAALAAAKKKTNASAAEVQKHLTKVNLAPGSEPLTFNFVGVITEMLEWQDAFYHKNGPLSHITKWQAIMNRCKSDPASIRWVFSHMIDFLKAGFYEGVETDDLREIRELMLSHKTYRQHLTPLPCASDLDVPTQTLNVEPKHLFTVALDGSTKRREKSFIMSLSLCEQVLHGPEYDHNFKTAVRNSKTAADVLTYAQFEEALKEIKDQVKKEKQTKMLEQGLPVPLEKPDQDSPPPEANDQPIASQYKSLDEAMKNATHDDREHWNRAARKLSRDWSKIFAPKDSEKEFIEEIASSEMGCGKGALAGLTLIHYNADLCGGSDHAPSTRPCNFQKKACDRAGALGESKSKKKDDEDCAGEAGGGEHDDEVDIGEGSTAQRLAPRKIIVVKGEKSVRERKVLSRGAASIKQTVGMQLASTSALSLPERQSLNYSGTNKGTFIGPVALRPLPEEWSTTVANKKKMLGEFRIRAGGKTEGDTKRLDTDIEPVRYLAFPPELCAELLHRYYVVNVIDLTPGDFTFGGVCMDRRITYYAIARSEEHAEAGREKLGKAALKCLATVGHAHHNQKCTGALKSKRPIDVDEDSNQPPRPMKRKKATPKSEAQPPAGEGEGPPEEPLVLKGKAKPKGKPKGKPKPKVEAEEGDDDDEAGSEWDLSGEDDK
ncbi:unnamed protein product [Prorocentrum cordatum]|uniref:Uncharacterized protein n=1 Tax=Prorocentrum cordatum TaxID=2364126 RepID=A0ABN9Y4U2_9DINO|nr:unnamed protein product [Polarella glacialis]